MALRIAVVSPQGGTGRSTLVAQLAASLTQAGRRCLAIDLDPQNTLGLLLGGNPGAWVAGTSTLHGSLSLLNLEQGPSALAESLRSKRSQVAHIPFGGRDLVRRRELKAELLARPEALRERLLSLEPASCELVLFDTPSGENPWSEAAIGSADLVLVLVRADAAGLASLPTYESFLRSINPRLFPRGVQYVLSMFDPTRQLASDIADVLAQCVEGDVLPRVVHDDETVREQLARGTPLALDPSAQAFHDYAWLSHFVGQIVGNHKSATASAHAS